MDYTTIVGTMYDMDGSPFEGALISFKLSAPFKTSEGKYMHNGEVTVYSNSLGRFEVTLPANDASDADSHYTVTVVQDTVREMKVIVPQSSVPVQFGKLERYKLPFERMPMIGDC